MHFISGLNKVSLLTSLYFAAQETRLAFILDLLFFKVQGTFLQRYFSLLKIFYHLVRMVSNELAI